jgi:ABC-type multidrug transport system ATPase subunit
MTVQVRHIMKTFGAVRAVVDVTLDLEPGSITVIEGPNGSGKSTLLAMIGTLVQPSAGTIDYGSLGATAAEVRSNLGWVGHDTLCYPDLTGRENVELAARLAGCANLEEAWKETVTRFVGVGEWATRPMRVASRGQRQRVALARAMVHHPKLLLLDEPSTGVDVRGVERIAEVIAEEAKRQVTVVVVTHDRTLSAALNRPSFQMDRGRLKRVAGATHEPNAR